MSEPQPHASADHPRPQLVRDGWQNLDGVWRFAYDDSDAGLRERWHAAEAEGAFGRDIVVPFAPESGASGIADTGFHPIVWYRRALAITAAAGRRVLLHFGAVDHDADVWVDGQHVGSHRGGYTAFSLDVTDALQSGPDHAIVVRAHDDPHEASLPRGKQDWELDPHVVWYHRSTGIWRTVWLEEVPDQHIAELNWTLDLARSRVELEVGLATAPAPDTAVTATLVHDGVTLGVGAAHATGRSVTLTVPVSALENGQARERYLWTPENPVLIDATVSVTREGQTVDTVASYIGLRTVETSGGRFLLNGRPYPVRAVLEQGYWADSLYTPPSVEAMRREVELIRELGFNAARIHQKVEDPRLLHWADRLGLLVWAELPSAYHYTPAGAAAITGEWLEAVRQQRNHPSVVTWVPLNESWGVQDIAHDPAQQAFSRALADATRALDPSRPVISNDGWEHQNSDIVGLHDYEGDPGVFAPRYAGAVPGDGLVSGFGPAGRAVFVGDAVYRGQPVMVTEFGGISYQPTGPRGDGWGYTEADTEATWLEQVAGLYRGVHASGFLAGSCYTQLTDTLQETNGLCTADRRPKAPVDSIRRAILGDAAPGSA
ncbi:glycoside hydrolase family 2 protein [Gryllotalpicola reticulitermitis]|uniref:Glycoside hydrolase family 2 protein n=1 Tax=Gryllotalpicola reticulitermitis TaxID=1184153 RepID=A0ABV8Q365_9MICO